MKLQIHDEIMRKHFRVAIFGSARIKKGDPIYRIIFKLAKRIGKAGIDIVTGGGPGLMDAANQGHHAGRKGNDAHSIGLTIKLPREQKDSFHLDVKKDFHKFSSRLDHFMILSNVVVVSPGGIGTILELMYTWQLVQVRQVCHIPIIMLGEMWPSFIDWIKKWPLKKRFISKDDLDAIFIVKTPKEAMRIISQTYDEYNRLGNNFCVNRKMYKLD